MVKTLILGGLAAAVMSGAALAQDMASVLPNNYVLSDILNKQRVDSAIGAPSGTARRAARPAPTRPAAQISTTYRASPQVSSRVIEQYSRRLAATLGPAEGPRVAEELRRGEPLRRWSRLVGADGLRPGDLADAVAGWWVLSWVVANGGDSNRAQALGAREQARAMLAQNPGLARLDEARLQEMAEVLMLDFVVQQDAYVQAMQRGDRAAARRLSDQAAARFQRDMGVDLRRVRLTERGFARLG